HLARVYVADLDLAARAWLATEYPPRHILMPVSLMGHETGSEIALRLHHARATAELARPRRRVVSHLVAVADKRQVHAEVLERIVARVAHQLLDRVRPVGKRPAAHRGLIH